MKLFSRGSAAKHDFEVTLHSVSPWPVDASSDLLVVSWRRGARRAGSVAVAGKRRGFDGGGDGSTTEIALDLSGATIAVPATLYKVRRGLMRLCSCSPSVRDQAIFRHRASGWGQRFG